MIAWETLQTGMPPLFADLLGIPCQWRTQPRVMVTGPTAVLDVISVVSIGVDDRRWTSDELSDVVTAEHVGVREMVVQVSVWSLSQMLQDSARAYLERLRTRVRLPSSLASLRLLGLALVTVEGIVQVDPIEGQRVVSQATCDLRFAVPSVATEPQAIVETVRVTSDELGVDRNLELAS